MGQCASASVERRSEPRYPKAFAFWIRLASGRRRTSGWMLDISTRGAAFLTPATEAPPVGARIELIEMQSSDRVVREGACPLPQFARVLRHDETRGVTCRVAARLEADSDAETDVGRYRIATMACPHLPTTPPLVPPPIPSPATSGISMPQR